MLKPLICIVHCSTEQLFHLDHLNHYLWILKVKLQDMGKNKNNNNIIIIKNTAENFRRAYLDIQEPSMSVWASNV